MDLIDTHCHLDVEDFEPDREAVIARARAAGVAAIVVPAIHAAGWQGLLALCASGPGLHPAFGLHPWGRR
jgi:TatD DNase family protein